VVAAQALTSVCLIDYRSMANFMDDKIPTAEAKMRQVLGLSGQVTPQPVNDQQRLARQAIRSQAAGRK